MDWKTLANNPNEWKTLKYDDPRLDAFAAEAEKKHNLPKGMLVALKNAGERTNPGQVSPVGAKGIMQFMAKEAKQFKHDVDDPFQSINAAGVYMKTLIDENINRWKNVHGSEKPIDMKRVYKAAIANYNGGPTQAKAVLRGQEPAAKETKDYLSRIVTYLDSKAASNVPAPAIPSEEEMAKMDHMDLLALRNKFPDKKDQELIAPYEHRAFAREMSESNPANAAALAVMIPGYQAAKAVGAMDARTDASMEELQQGFVGVYEGLRAKFLSKDGAE